MAHLTISILALLAVVINNVSSRSIIRRSETPVTANIPRVLFNTFHTFRCPALYGRYPVRENCDYFFECKYGYATLMHCNRGYLYDAEKRQCRDRRRVKCHLGGVDQEDNHEEIEGHKDIRYFRCPYLWGTFSHPTDCSQYFVCLYDVPKLYQCYRGYLYDEKIRKCIPKSRVKCGKRLDKDQIKTSKKPRGTTTVRPEATTAEEILTTVEGHTKITCPSMYGRYPDPQDCSRYYVCRFYVPYLYQCPTSTLYDEGKEECVKGRHVKCGARPGGNDEDVVEPELDHKGIFKCPYIWGTFAHPADCSKYIVCVHNVPAVFSCRGNELFHARYRRCLPKNKVSCDKRINPYDPARPLTTTLSTTAKPSTTVRALIPSTIAKILLSTILSTEQPKFTTITRVPRSSTLVQKTTEMRPSTTMAPVTRTTRLVPTTTIAIPTTTRLVPTTTIAVPTNSRLVPTTTTAVPITTRLVPTTNGFVPTTSTAVPTTTRLVPTTTRLPTTNTVVPTTTIAAPTTNRLITTTTRFVPATTRRIPTTRLPSTTTRPVPTTRLPSTTTRPVSTTTAPETTNSEFPATKPNTPPPTDCHEDDLDCIIDGTGDVSGWFDCPKKFGHFSHGGSKQLFIHCDNWRPFIKKCADQTVFSPQYLVCVWVDKEKGI